MNQIDSWTILSWTDGDYLITATKKVLEKTLVASKGLIAALAIAVTLNINAPAIDQSALFTNDAVQTTLSKSGTDDIQERHAFETSLTNIKNVLSQFEQGTLTFPNANIAALAEKAALTVFPHQTHEQWADAVIANTRKFV